LRKQLTAAVQSSRAPLTLEILADKSARLDVAYRLMGFAEEAGFKAVHCVVRSQPLPNRAEPPSR
jgi:biopolymer transport protein ExbD